MKNPSHGLRIEAFGPFSLPGHTRLYTKKYIKKVLKKGLTFYSICAILYSESEGNKTPRDIKGRDHHEKGNYYYDEQGTVSLSDGRRNCDC